tara:strand:+ start:142 stop:801 length:660 start_codon:yes stop_codon:yes gene_type:complete
MGAAAKVVSGIPIVGDVVQAVAAPVSKGKWIGKGDKDPNKLAYQWSVKKEHEKSKGAAGESKDRGAFTGDITDWGGVSSAAKTAGDTGASAYVTKANQSDAQRRAELEQELITTKQSYDTATQTAQQNLASEMAQNQVAGIAGLSEAQRAANEKAKVTQGAKDAPVNLFGSKGDVKVPGDPGYGSMEEEEEKFGFKGVNDPNFKDFLASLKAKKSGDFN